MREIFTRHRKRYLRRVTERYRAPGVGWLPLRGMPPPELAHLYVSLRLAPRPTDPIDALPRALRAGSHEIWDYFHAAQIADRTLAIVGPPGCGKSTLLQHVALTLAAGRESRRTADVPHRLPILLSLQDCAAQISATGANPLSLVQAVRASFGTAGPEVPDRWLERQLRAGRCLVMLDGLDRATDTRARERVVAWIEAQRARYGGSRFIVTSRAGHWDDALEQATVLEIRPLSRAQVEQLVENWDLAGPGAGREAAPGADDLIRHACADPALAANPLNLTLLCIVHGQGRPLPQWRAALYAEACDLYLGGGPVDLTPAQARRLLQLLAYHMICQRLCEIDLQEAEQVIAPLLARMDGQRTARAFLESVAAGGLLVASERPRYCFVHLTFQEYLAAAHVPETSPQAALERVSDRWWHGTLLSYAQQADATAVVDACLGGDAPSASALGLAVACAGAHEIAPQSRERLGRALRAEAESAVPERYRLAAEALLDARLRRMVCLGEDRCADNGLVTHAEYQLFLDERSARGEHRQPDHWSGDRFPAGQALMPVAGVRFGDAAAFCEWLTQREPGRGWRYRLPRAGELNPGDVAFPAGMSREDAAAMPGYWVLVEGQGQCVRLDRDMAAAGMGLDQHVALALSRDLTRAWGHAHDLVRARTIARARASERYPGGYDAAAAGPSDLDRALSRARASDRVLARARDVALARIIDHAGVIARTRAAYLDLDAASAFAGLDARFVDRDLARDIASVIARVRDRAIDRTVDLLYESVIALDLVRVSASARDLGRGGGNAHALARDLSRAADRARAHDLNLADDISKASTLAVDLADNLARATDRALATATHHAREVDLACAVDLPAAIDRARDPALARAVDLAHAGDPATASDFAGALALDLDVVRARAVDLVGHHTDDSAASLIRTLARASALARDLALAYALASDLDSDLSIVDALSRASNESVLASDYDDIARSLRWHVRMQMLALAVRLYHRLSDKDAQQLYHTCLNLYIDLVLLEERIEGNLPAFEGIRIVREEEGR